MPETGLVREISGDLVVLSLDRPGACSGCGQGGARGACGSAGAGSTPGCRSNQVLLTALNRKKLPLVPGQRVAVEFPPGSALVQALTALLPPFWGFIAGYALGGLALSPESQALRAAAGGGGLFFSAGIVYFIRKCLPPGKPTVVYYSEEIVRNPRSPNIPILS
ncbi:MAG: SoxR reducing system RseC family protein [Spirochaetaceae bacterium]|jgi:positive regulator of sigma E activity|nr:SoxR reducing system RseC family protein [Spirochaetaceae bacterium]